MSKSLKGNHKGRRVNKARLGAALLGLGLAGKITISSLANAFNNNDDVNIRETVTAVESQMNEEERNQLKLVLGEENYSKINDFLKYSNVILRGDSNDAEAKRYIDENLDAFHDIYLETLKMKIAEMAGMTNPNQIRNITIHRNVIKDGEAPRYQYVIEKVYNQVQDKETKERLDEAMTLNLFTGDYTFETTNEDITNHIDNVIEISELAEKQNKSESDYKRIALFGNSCGRMLNDKIQVGNKKGFFEKLTKGADSFEYKVVEDNQYNYTPDPDKGTSIETELASKDNDDMDI